MEVEEIFLCCLNSDLNELDKLARKLRESQFTNDDFDKIVDFINDSEKEKIEKLIHDNESWKI